MGDESLGLDLDELRAALVTMPLLLNGLVYVMSERAVSFHPTPTGWCVKQVIGHLIEDDRRDFVARADLMIHDCEPFLTVTDQNAVARLRRDCDDSIGCLLSKFEAVRAASVEFLGRLTPGDLHRTGIHPQTGRITVHDLVQEWVYHDLNHLKQIDSNFQSFLWNSLGTLQRFYRQESPRQ